MTFTETMKPEKKKLVSATLQCSTGDLICLPKSTAKILLGLVEGIAPLWEDYKGKDKHLEAIDTLKKALT